MFVYFGIKNDLCGLLSTVYNMTRIGIMSDTHGYLSPKVFDYFKDCDEVWHAGDIGTLALADELAAFKPLRAVYGNIDNDKIRRVYPLNLYFKVEEVRVFMTHIASKPPRYPKRVQQCLAAYDELPNIFVCGHSHILQVARAAPYGNMLHVNPGAAGKKGFHRVCTLVRLAIDGARIFDFEVIEFSRY